MSSITGVLHSGSVHGWCACVPPCKAKRQYLLTRRSKQILPFGFAEQCGQGGLNNDVYPQSTRRTQVGILILFVILMDPLCVERQRMTALIQGAGMTSRWSEPRSNLYNITEYIRFVDTVIRANLNKAHMTQLIEAYKISINKLLIHKNDLISFNMFNVIIKQIQKALTTTCTRLWSINNSISKRTTETNQRG